MIAEVILWALGFLFGIPVLLFLLAAWARFLIVQFRKWFDKL